MSYLHHFYGIDLDRLAKLHGSRDKAMFSEIASAMAEDLEDNDGFFEDEIEEGDFPSSEQALKEIVGGAYKFEDAEAMYGYVLKIICEHLGERISGGDVAAVADHPYASKLVSSGPPIPIPYDQGDFPEIGYLSLADIPGEMARIDAAPIHPDRDMAEDVTSFRATLALALEKGVSIVSVRH